VGLFSSAERTRASSAGEWKVSHQVAEMSWPSTKRWGAPPLSAALAVWAGNGAGV
jgi:hypothetical protein